jgi:glycine cleavage system H protein
VKGAPDYFLPSARLFAFHFYMSNIPADLKFTKDHEWLKPEADGTATVGITDYAQTTLGDVTFVELPEQGAHLDAGASLGVVESVKAASDVYMPVAGTVTEVNSALADDPGAINSDPYGAGWMIKVRPDNAADFSSLLTADEYRALV